MKMIGQVWAYLGHHCRCQRKYHLPSQSRCSARPHHLRPPDYLLKRPNSPESLAGSSKCSHSPCQTGATATLSGHFGSFAQSEKSLTTSCLKVPAQNTHLSLHIQMIAIKMQASWRSAYNFLLLCFGFKTLLNNHVPNSSRFGFLGALQRAELRRRLRHWTQRPSEGLF